MAPHLAHTFPIKHTTSDVSDSDTVALEDGLTRQAAENNDTPNHIVTKTSEENVGIIHQKDLSSSGSKSSEASFSEPSTVASKVLNVTESPEQKSDVHTVAEDAYPGERAKFRILEVGCGVGNTVFPILKTNNDERLFVYCCDFSTTAVDIVKESPDYERAR